MKKVFLKKPVSIILSLCMILSIMMTGVFAIGVSEDFVIENGVLVRYNGTDENVVIPDGATKIESNAFSDCYSLKSVVIPDSVTFIGYMAFSNCDSLTSVTIPGGVRTIGGAAFFSCDSLAEVTIEEGVASIDYQAFYDCGSLTEISIPASVTTIGESVFWQCVKLENIDVNEANTNYSDEDGVLFNKSKTAIICCAGGKQGSYNIPDSVTYIGRYAFADCSGLTEIIMPSGLSAIDNSAFYNCDGITSVTIPGRVETIKYNVFSDCDKLSEINVDEANPKYSSEDGVVFNKLKTEILIYPCGRQGSYVIPDNVTVIWENAFETCRKLTSVTIPNGVMSIGEYAFSECRELEDIIIPDSVSYIGFFAFYNCESLTQITVPENVNEIFGDVFSGCCKLLQIDVDEANQKYSSVDGVMFDKYKETLICYPAGKQGEYVIPDSVKSIKNQAFVNCRELTSVTISKSVTAIEDYAFDGCDKLIIRCYENSYAHTFAMANDIPFDFIPKRPIDDITDISPSHWSYEAVAECMDEDILHGKEDNKFDPDGNMTRAEFCQMIYNYYKNTEVMQGSEDKHFADVPEDEWYAEAVLACAKAGIVNGVDENNFEPDSQIKREDVCVIMMRILMGKDNVNAIDADAKMAELKQNGNKLADIEITSDYALKYVLCAISVIINGDKDEGTIRPLDNISRAECAQIMYNYLFK